LVSADVNMLMWRLMWVLMWRLMWRLDVAADFI
jgi:hypothetical protein